MPWSARDAPGFTKRARTARQRRQWARVANRALASCIEGGGDAATCEAGAIRQANGVLASNERNIMPALFFVAAEASGSGREEVLGGDKYLVRPLKIIRSMVLNGAGDGPANQYLPASELTKCPVAAWNNIPLTLGHPFQGENGDMKYLSANSPAMVQRFAIGKIFGANMDDDGRVEAEAWLHVDTCESMGGVATKALNVFKANETAEVSSAYLFNLDETPGQAPDGMAYNAVQRDIYPDHVAILIDGVGACSNANGCGLGINQGCSCGGGESLGIMQRFVKAIEGIIKIQAVPEPDADPEPVAINKEGDDVEPIKTVEELMACNEVDQSVKDTIKASMAFQAAEEEKANAARADRVVKLAENEAVPFTLDQLKAMDDDMLTATEKLLDARPATVATNYQGQGIPQSMLTVNADEYPPQPKSTIPTLN